MRYLCLSISARSLMKHVHNGQCIPFPPEFQEIPSYKLLNISVTLAVRLQQFVTKWADRRCTIYIFSMFSFV